MTTENPSSDADGLDDAPVADALPGNLVDRYAPEAIRPYLRLARVDRPIGTWLLLFPCWWSLALAHVSEGHPYPSLVSLALFAAGAFIMRGAGCAYNDYIDRDYDARVARTASRPIPSGQVTPENALLFAAALFARRLLHSNLVQPLHHPARHRLSRPRRRLPVPEAAHPLAADRARPRLQLGGARRLERGHGLARAAGHPALSRLGAVDDRLRHHLRPSGRARTT